RDVPRAAAQGAATRGGRARAAVLQLHQRRQAHDRALLTARSAVLSPRAPPAARRPKLRRDPRAVRRPRYGGQDVVLSRSLLTSVLTSGSSFRPLSGTDM